jgi:hypothetical protein
MILFLKNAGVKENRKTFCAKRSDGIANQPPEILEKIDEKWPSPVNPLA